MSTFIGRFSGIVSYSDNTHSQFAAHMDERGNISLNCAVGSNQTIVEEQNINPTELGAGAVSQIKAILALVSTTLALSPDGTPAKTVTGATVSFNGRIARDDNTSEDFGVSYTLKSGAIIQDDSGTGGTTGAYDELAAAGDTAGDIVKLWLEAMVGLGNVTV